MTPDNNRALWRHVYFIYRVLLVVVVRLFGSKEEFATAFKSVARDGDERLIDEFIK